MVSSPKRIACVIQAIAVETLIRLPALGQDSAVVGTWPGFQRDEVLAVAVEVRGGTRVPREVSSVSPEALTANQ